VPSTSFDVIHSSHYLCYSLVDMQSYSLANVVPYNLVGGNVKHCSIQSNRSDSYVKLSVSSRRQRDVASKFRATVGGKFIGKLTTRGNGRPLRRNTVIIVLISSITGRWWSREMETLRCVDHATDATPEDLKTPKRNRLFHCNRSTFAIVAWTKLSRMTSRRKHDICQCWN